MKLQLDPKRIKNYGSVRTNLDLFVQKLDLFVQNLYLYSISKKRIQNTKLRKLSAI